MILQSNMLIIQNKSKIRLIIKVLVIFNLVANFPHFTKNILLQIPWFFYKNSQNICQNLPQMPTI